MALAQAHVVPPKLGFCIDDGTVWKVNQKGKETILHNFAGGPSDGCNPNGGVARDSNGNLYGLTDACGAESYGTLYELSASGKFTLLYSLDCWTGAWPYDEVLRTRNGALAGTALGGGAYGYGAVWKYTP